MNKAKKLHQTQIERPDKAFVGVMLGILLLLGGIGFAVFDYGIYRDYGYAVNRAESIRRNPGIVTDSQVNPDKFIAWSEEDAAHYRQQMIWVSAVTLLFLSGGAFLLTRAVKNYRRLKNLEYEEIDWRSLEKPTHRVEVLYGRTHTVAAIIFYIFFGGLTLLAVLTSVKPDGIRLPGIVIGVFNFTLIGVMYYVLNNGEKRSIKSFDASCIARGDGKHFLWSDFRGVITRIGTFRSGGKITWRTELVFASGGIVWVIPQRIKNYAEVYGFVETLPQAVLKDAA